MSKTKLKLCERCEKCLYDPNEYRQCRSCYLKYMKDCDCEENKYDSYLYKQCYDCSKKQFTKSRIVNIDDLELLPEDD